MFRVSIVAEETVYGLHITVTAFEYAPGSPRAALTDREAWVGVPDRHWAAGGADLQSKVLEVWEELGQRFLA